METQKLNPTENDYSNRYFKDKERYMLLIPEEEITFKIKVKELTTLRMYFEQVKIEIAKKENTIDL